MRHHSTSIFARCSLWRSALALIAATMLLGGCSKFDNSQSAQNGPQVTAKFFDAKFHDVKGNIVDLTALHGKVVVVNFWSTWCPPCVEEMPMFSEVQTQWKDKNVVFVGIAADQADNVKEFLNKTPVNYPIVVGGQAGFELSQQLGNRHDAVPFTVIINAKDGISSRHFAIYSRQDLEADLAKATK
ncbi:MAG: TlpA family protein disulfide reductase [Fluviibacter sp.]